MKPHSPNPRLLRPDILLIICFLMGIANFAMHAAVAESGHPFVEDAKVHFGRHFGKYGSYAIEFVILAGAMLFAQWGSNIVVIVYAGYTSLNAFAAWMLLSGRP